jgi:hypothetical protein
MIGQVADATGETVSYSYRPSVFGAFREFSLTERGIDWAAFGDCACPTGRTACSRTVS